MAASQAKMAPVGSAQWIQNERDNAAQLIEQEVEEFGYSARNEFEWLNEHMADIFSTNQVNFADVFKTPGKLRGKTPRTARKRDALAPRQPLTDIFAPNAQIPPPPAQTNAFYDKVAHFRIAEDQESAPQYRPTSRGKSPQRVGKPGNTDSGYHGMTEDEMDVDPRTETATASSQQSDGHKVPLRDDQARPQPVRQDTAGGRTSEESFISAKEDLSSRNASREELREENDSDTANLPEDEMQVDQPEVSETPAAEIAVHEVEEERMDEEIDEESPRSPSDTSSPGKPLQRKSSFTFSALPAREPLTAKRSIGFRDSQIDAGRGSVLGRSLGGKSLAVAQDDDESFEQEKPEEAKMHNKTSTQSLHERIMMLGKTKEPRTSKSIPQNMLAAQPVYPQLPSADGETNGVSGAPEVATKTEVHDFAQADDDDDDDDWIAPSKPTQAVPQKAFAHATQHSHTPVGSPVRPGMHQKSISTNNIPSPSRPAMALGHQKSQSVSNPSLANAPGMIQSTTPAGTPNGKKHHDGALSTSKNMLRSAFKSAKGLFASSASTSVAAKLEARNHSPAPQRSPKRDFSDESKTAAVFNMPGALYSQQQFPQSPTRPTSVKSASPSRKTRSSTESDKKRQKEMKAQQKAAEGLEKVREKERQKVAKQQEEKRKAEEAEAEKKAAKERQQAAERPVSADSDSARDVEMPPPPPPKSMLPAGKLRAPGRLIRPTREQPAPSRPAPVSIRVTSQSQRLGQPAQPTFSKSQHESMAPPPPPKTGLRTASAQGNVRSSTAPNNARVKALEAAARKKEADEKAAQKKIEQKREMERKRAAKAEEERRAEDERRAAEQARVQEAKLAAQRKAEQQAADTRKREQQRLDQQRQQEEAQKARAAHELAEAIQRERAAAAPPHARGDVGGTLRQLAKNTVAEQHARNAAQPNPAKPAKRIFQPEDDEQQYAPPQRPGMQRAPPSYQQSDAKRRRTNEEQEEVERHSVMAPPKRPSNMRKESTLNKFPHGYSHAPPPAAHHTGSMFKSTVTSQHQLQHAGKPIPSHPSQTVQMSSARIPFAENANPPAQAPQYAAYQQQAHHGGIENTHPSAAASNNKFKTPGRPAAQAPKSANMKSSPAYPKGDNIELPEIQTDSEEEDDSEDEDATGGFRAPSWVASPALRDLLTSQQLVDPETVFGPIGELRMEEVFKNGGKNGDRLKRFRDRGSSAAWVETGDAVTSAEKRRDMEMRERVVREGGWRYEPNA